MFGASAVGTTAVVAIALVAISRNGEVLAKYSRNSLGEEREPERVERYPLQGVCESRHRQAVCFDRVLPFT